MTVQEIDGGIIIVTDERMDSLHGPKLRDTVKEFSQERGVKLVIDMGKTLFLDSTGCGELLSCLKAVISKDGEMKIARPTPRILEIFQLTRLDKVFMIYDSVDSALESFR